MKAEKKENLLRCLLICIFLGMIAVFASGIVLFTDEQGYKKYNIDENVTFQINDSESEKVSLKKYSFTVPKRGDYITLSTKVPEIDIEQPLLVFNVYHCTLEVYVDGELVYDYGKELYESGSVVGHAYFRIPLEKDISGKELKLRMRVTEENSFSSIEELYLIEAGKGYADLIAKRWLTLMVTLTFLCIGIVGMFASLTRKHFDKDTRSLTWLAVFSIGISIWMMCSDNIIYLFVENSQTASLLEYYSLYISMLPVTLFFANVQVRERYRKILLGICWVIFSENVLIVLCQVLGLVHYISWIPCMQATMAVLVLFTFYSLARTYKESGTRQRILVYGMSFLAFVVMLELLRFNLYKYFNNIMPGDTSLMPIGTLIFVLAMVYSYCIRTVESYYDKAEKQVLEKLAYMDTLTNTYNRNKCEALLEEMETEKRRGYLLNFDLNGLKVVNDTKGHTYGDAMLKAFAKILCDTFQNIGIAGRMGGDEFLVVMYDTTEDKVTEALQNMEKNIAGWNRVHKDNQVSVSYGYAAYEPEQEEPIRRVYEQADAQMYACKQEIKRRQQEQNKMLPDR